MDKNCECPEFHHLHHHHLFDLDVDLDFAMTSHDYLWVTGGTVENLVMPTPLMFIQKWTWCAL